MTGFSVLILAAIYGGLLSSCIIAVPYVCGFGKVHGSGNVKTQVREVKEFTRVHLKGTGRIILSHGDIRKVSITTDDNILPIIKTIVSNHILNITHKSISVKPTTLEYHLTVPRINGVAISGSGDVVGQSDFNVNTFEAIIKGSGDMSLAIDARRLAADISGSGSINLTGKTEEFQVSIKGSGDIRAHNLEAKNAVVVISGSGDCRLKTLESLQATIKGSGDVLYSGRPRVESHIKGSGSVKSEN